ncbi:MAG: hypothetical protein WC694_00475 [Candidatus Paceibacterota bacterium]|jgi:hypothetical protein
MLNLKWAKRGVVWSIVIILILTILEFPSPIGFETRPQDNVSILWLIFFLIILITEIVTVSLILKHPRLGVKFAICAAILNILQIFADQLHLMQPEIASFGYTLLEYSVGIVALFLAYFAFKIYRFISPAV